MAKFTKKPIMTSAPVTVAAPAQRSEIKGSGTTIKAASPVARQITHEMVERRAYEIYASRGYAAGDPVADWYEAERQLRAGL